MAIDKELNVILQTILAELSNLKEQVAGLTATPATPTAQLIVGGINWEEILAIDASKWAAPLSPINEFNGFEMCLRAWNGYNSNGTIRWTGSSLNAVQNTVRDIVFNKNVTTNVKPLSANAKQAVTEYRSVLRGVSQRKLASIAVDFDLEVADLYMLHLRDLVATAMANNIHPDLFNWLILSGTVDQYQPDSVLSSPTVTHLAFYAGKNLEMYWESSKGIGGGGASGELLG